MRKTRSRAKQPRKPLNEVFDCATTIPRSANWPLPTDIHIRIQQRNGRKTLTTVEGIPAKFDLKKVLKVIKKQFACNGTIVQDEKAGDIIQLQGDQRNAVKDFLIDPAGLEMDAKTIKVHGF